MVKSSHGHLWYLHYTTFTISNSHSTHCQTLWQRSRESGTPSVGKFVFFFNYTHQLYHIDQFHYKLGKKAGGTSMMLLGCGPVTVTTMVGASKKMKFFFTGYNFLNHILYLAKDIYISYRHI